MRIDIGIRALLALALCSAGTAHAQSTTSGGPVLAFTVTDSSVRGPATFTAGIVTLQLINHGTGVHALHLMEVTAGHTAEEAKAYLRANSALPPASPLRIGIGPVAGGQTLTVTVKLPAGHYLMIDRLPDSKGHPNYLAGVMLPFVGTGDETRDAANIPAGSGVMLSNRFRFGNLFRTGNTWTLSENRNRNTQLRPGLQTIRVESFQSGNHTVVLARGGPEVMRQYADWTEGRRPTPPAGLVGGVIDIPGVSNRPTEMARNRAFLQVRLAPGGYILFCPKRGATQLYGFETGEYAQFVVQ